MTIQELEQAIRLYNAAYRAGQSTISDSRYDKLVEELKERDPENAWFKHIEPVTVSDARKRKLPIPMKSLDKVKNIGQLKMWAKSLGLPATQEMVIMPKYDGLSLLYNEETGNAYSRGGIENEGQDCTNHAKAAMIERVGDSRLQYTYGELVFSVANWEGQFKDKISDYSGTPYKSPRNTVAGFLNRDEATPLLAYTTFARYGTDMESLKNYPKFSTLLEELEEPEEEYHAFLTYMRDIDEQLLLDLFEKWRKDFYIDGLVIYINDTSLWYTIGRHQTSGNPMYAIAYKHPDFTESFETKVLGVNWKVSKSGALKPVVKIDAVDTGDCNMENPTGYNAGWLSNHNVAPGATILVTRSGGVIPKILSVIHRGTEEQEQSMWDDIAVCPHCGSPTAWGNNYIEMMCTNPECCGVRLAKIVFFYNICKAENMGEETIAKIFNAGFQTISSMLRVTASDLLKLDGFGDAIVDNVLDNNQRILQGLSMSTLMHASDCFKGIGVVKAEAIIDNMSGCDRQLFYNQQYSVPSLERRKHLTKTAQAFYDGIPAFYRFLQNTNIPVLPYVSMHQPDGPLLGMNICMSGFRDKEMEDAIANRGGNVVSGVSKKTSYLVVADINSNSSKIDKAKQYEIKIISKSEFDKILKNN